MSDEVIVLAPTRVEAHVMGARTVVTGTGAASVADAVARLLPALAPGTAVAVTGTAERLSAGLLPGQLVVATELWTAGPRTAPRLVRRLPSASLLADELRRDGHVVAEGPVVSTSEAYDESPGAHPVLGAIAEPACQRRGVRGELVHLGALVLDHDSAWAAALADRDRPLAVV
ncbi:MAG: hypothetical protein M0010_04460, partial [Actinomycetota bacterium]|nr:hypothetical protein [Actinomycetota bacterium]